MSQLVKFNKDDFRFNQVKFVLKAIDQNSPKPFFQVLHSTGAKIVGTDSRRLHIANVPIPEGNYEILVNTRNKIILHESDEGFKFPNWEAVIPKDYKERVKEEFYYSEIGALKFDRLLPEHCGLNLNFLSDLKGFSWNAYIDTTPENFNAVVFEAGDLMAVIMPIRLRESETL